MAEEYTPAIEDVRDGYRRARYYLDDDAPEDEPYRSGGPEFDRWLAAHDAEVKAEAWDEGYTVGNAHNGRRDANPYRTEAPHA